VGGKLAELLGSKVFHQQDKVLLMNSYLLVIFLGFDMEDNMALHFY